MSEPDGLPWERFNAAQAGRAVRPLLLQALAHAGPGRGRVAIDLGCGAGVEASWLVESGWTVHALDSDEQSLQRLAGSTAGDGGRLHPRVVDLDDLPALPQADLVYAGYALPFTRPERFDQMWGTVVQALSPGALLAVNLFGDHDSWVDAVPGTYLTEQRVRALLEGLVVLHFHVEDEDGMAFDGPKHWHVFDVIARRAREQQLAAGAQVPPPAPSPPP
jgi:trans-aconitate methyltransferase